MAFRRCTTTPFPRPGASEPEEGGRSEELGTANEERAGQPKAGRDVEAGEVRPAYRRSTTSVFSSLSGRSRLSSRVFMSPPKKLLGHLAVCGDRLRHRTGVRTKNEDKNEDDGLTGPESKVLPAAVSGPPPIVAHPPSTIFSRSKAEEKPPPSPNQQMPYVPPPQQQCLLYRHQQLAAPYGEHEKQQEISDEEIEKEELQTRVPKEEQKQSSHTLDKQRIGAEGTYKASTEASLFAGKVYTLHAPVTPCDPAQAHLTERRPFSGHRSSTSTNASRRSSNGSESIPPNPASPAETHEVGGLFLAPASIGDTWCSTAIERDRSSPKGLGKSAYSKSGNDNSGNSVRLNNAEARHTGVEGTTGEISTGNIREFDCGAEDDKVEGAAGQSVAGTAYPYGRVRDSSISMAKEGDLPRDDRTGMSSLPFGRFSDEKRTSLGVAQVSTTPPLLVLAPHNVITSAAQCSDGSVLPCTPDTRSGSDSAASSVAAPETQSFTLSGVAYPVSSAPALSSATSPVPAAAAGRSKKKTVGMRLSGMLQQGRTVLKFGSAEKEATPAPAGPPRSLTVPNVRLRSESAPAAPAKSTFSQKQAGDVPSSESSRLPLSLFPRSSPLLLRQLRRRAPGTRRGAGLPYETDKNAGNVVVTTGNRGEQSFQRDLKSMAVSAGSAGGVTSGKADQRTGETTRRAGVLRRDTEEAWARREGGRKTERGDGSITMARETAMLRGAREGRSGRRLTSSGVPEASHDGDRQAKCVRFGSMSIHVYTREARIRSCSSDSVNFAVTLDPPISTDGHSHRAHNRPRIAFTQAIDDFSDGDSYSAEDEESYDEIGDQEDDEEIRATRKYGSHTYRWEGGRHGHYGRSQDSDSAFTEHAAAMLHAREHRPAVENILPHPRGSVTQHRDARWHEREDPHLAGAPPKEAERERHTNTADGSEDNTVSTFEQYLPAFEDLYGKPQTVCLSSEQRGSHRDMGLVTDDEQPAPCVTSGPSAPSPATIREVSSTNDANLPQQQPVERQAQETEKRSTPTVRDGVHSRSAQHVESGHASIFESCKVGEENPHSTACSQSSPQSSSLTSGYEPQTQSAAHSTSTRIIEPNTADWWRRLLSNSSTESEEACTDARRQSLLQREPTNESAGDKHIQPMLAEVKADVAETRQVTVKTTPTASSYTAGGSPADDLGSANETVCHSSSLSRQDHRLTSNDEWVEGPEMGTPEQKQKFTVEGSSGNVRRPYTSTAFSQEEGGLPGMWTQSRVKPSDPEEKSTKCPGGPTQLGSVPRRLHSDEHAGTAPSYVQWQRALLDAITRDEHKGAPQQSLPEFRYLHVSDRKEVVPPPGPVMDQHVNGADEASYSLVHGVKKLPTEEYYPAEIHGEQVHLSRERKSLYSDISSLLEDPGLKSHGSSTGISSSSTIASRGLCSDYGSASTLQDLPSRYKSSDIFSQQDLHGRTGSDPTILGCDCSSISSHPCPHSKGVTQHSLPSDIPVKQHGAPERHQHQLILHKELSKSNEPAPRGEIGSRSSVSSGGRGSLDEEMLSKATEEVIARSASHMSAEEKENLRDILKGWCS